MLLCPRCSSVLKLKQKKNPDSYMLCKVMAHSTKWMMKGDQEIGTALV
jgi:hypothetical protein